MISMLRRTLKRRKGLSNMNSDLADRSGGVVNKQLDYQQTPVCTDWKRYVWLDDHMRLLESDKEFAFANVLYSLGKVILTERIPTAAVAFRQREVQLLFNPRFVDWMIAKGKTVTLFVLMHEAMHILFGHRTRMRDRHPLIWNIATDLVVNTLLKESNHFRGMPRALQALGAIDQTSLKCPDSISHGTAELAYEWIRTRFHSMKSEDLKLIDTHQADPEKQSSDGSGLGEDPEQKQNDTIESQITDEMSEKTEQAARQAMIDQVDSSVGVFQELDNQSSSRAGSTPKGELRTIVDLLPSRQCSWDDLLVRRLATAYTQFAVENWIPSRKMRMWYPQVVLPSEVDDEVQKKFDVLVAIDSSGSISVPALKSMIEVIRTLPMNKMQLSAMSFDTHPYAIPDTARLLKGDTSTVRGGGGTDFQCVEVVVSGKAPKVMARKTHPDLVLVLTDGHASSITPSQPNKWLWLITPGGDCAAPKASGGDVYYMDKVTSRVSK